MGRLEVVCGPMFSGKSEELMRRLRRAQIAGKTVILLKPVIDTRTGRNTVKSHSGYQMPAQAVARSGDLHIASLGYDVIGVDEVQFFEDVVDHLRARAEKSVVIASGLDMTFRAEPFGDMPTLLAVADRIDKLTAVCHTCGQDATLSQRLIDGKPASFEGPTLQVGGLESYEARCRRCYRAA